jgi:hypothetical protein
MRVIPHDDCEGEAARGKIGEEGVCVAAGWISESVEEKTTARKDDHKE